MRARKHFRFFLRSLTPTQRPRGKYPDAFVFMSNQIASSESSRGEMRCMNRRCERVLFRNMWHTRREGSRQRRALHVSAVATQTGSAPPIDPLPTEGAVSIPFATEECRAHSAQRRCVVLRHGHANMAAQARRRCHCAGWLRPLLRANCPRALACARGCLDDAPCARDALRSSPACMWQSSRNSSADVLLGLREQLWVMLPTCCAPEAPRRRVATGGSFVRAMMLDVRPVSTFNELRGEVIAVPMDLPKQTGIVCVESTSFHEVHAAESEGHLELTYVY